ncbi:uncharacterized protein LOC128547752 [Mercenaria mercenaria]|uniref:uncharacterized protein LOC128547752 n=1 Tax=Mercenaria mercenaria TaxID=6596 RepID=UPI00234F00BF|nr:uncharacterized protein LOC128547752 [Mercenaria mercenaria]
MLEYGINVKLLVDNGSSATLLSNRIYSSIEASKRPELHHISNTMQGANGHGIELYGRIRVTLRLGDSSFDTHAIVCDIVPDGILGQDFLLRHASNIDYDKTTIFTDRTPINCWVGGEAQTRCRVLTTSEVQIPPISLVRTPIQIENAETLSDLALMCSSKSLLSGKSTIAVEGVIQPYNKSPGICLVNTSEKEVKIPQNVPIGFCESYNEAKPTATYTSRVTNVSPSGGNLEVPEHLKDLYERSVTDLTEEQAVKLSELLIKYQDVFAKSPEDLGRNNSVLHKINTGQAKPIRQPPRRQPIGIRDTEKEEVYKMLDRGVIEQSKSSWSSPIVLVTKKDNSTCFCVDYRRLNDVTEKGCLPNTTG